MCPCAVVCTSIFVKTYCMLLHMGTSALVLLRMSIFGSKLSGYGSAPRLNNNMHAQRSQQCQEEWGPEDHINTRISHSGSKAQCQGIPGSECLCGLRGSFCSRTPRAESARVAPLRAQISNRRLAWSALWEPQSTGPLAFCETRVNRQKECHVS